MRTSSILYIKTIEIGEGLGKPGARLLTVTEKVWRVE